MEGFIRKVEVHITPTAKEMAEAWCNMDGDQQAEFFSVIHDISSAWKKPFCFQLEYIATSPFLNNGGRDIMDQIGRYSKPYKKDSCPVCGCTDWITTSEYGTECVRCLHKKDSFLIPKDLRP